jgi:hypothetical protein
MSSFLSLNILSHCYKMFCTNSVQKQKVSKMTEPVWRTRASLLTLYFLSSRFSLSWFMAILRWSIVTKRVVIEPIASSIVKMILYSCITVINSLKIGECKSYWVVSFKVNWSCRRSFMICSLTRSLSRSDSLMALIELSWPNITSMRLDR